MLAQQQPHAWESHVLDRRRKVAALRVRGLTQREVAKALPMEPNPVLNPDTGRPYDVATISRDLQHIEDEWREASIAHLSAHKARHLAELQEVKRAAWQQNKLFYILKALEQEAALLGLNELPEVPGVTINNTANFDLTGLSDDDLARLGAILDAAEAPIVEGGEAPRSIEAG